MIPSQPEWKAMVRRSEKIQSRKMTKRGEMAAKSARRQPTDQYRPTTSPFSSMSIRSAAGLLESPGMVRMSPLTR